MLKLANTDRGIFHIFWTTPGISIKFSGKMWLMIILKVQKNKDFNLSLKDKFFEQPQGSQFVSPAILGLKMDKDCVTQVKDLI